MDELQDKVKQREALEDAYSNFVEPYVNQLIEIPQESIPAVPAISPSCFGWVSGWLLVTLLYCMAMRWR